MLSIELYPRNSHLPFLPFHTKRSPSRCGIPHQSGAPPCQTWTNRPSQSQTPGCSKLPLQSSLTTILYTVLQQMKPSVCFVCLYCCLPSMVSAWASKAKAVFGQLAADEKSNEITAVPELLELLDGSAKNRHRLFTVTIARCHVSTERLRCKKKRAVKNRLENPILHSSGSFVYFSFRPSGRFFRFSF